MEHLAAPTLVSWAFRLSYLREFRPRALRRGSIPPRGLPIRQDLGITCKPIEACVIGHVASSAERLGSEFVRISLARCASTSPEGFQDFLSDPRWKQGVSRLRACATMAGHRRQTGQDSCGARKTTPLRLGIKLPRASVFRASWRAFPRYRADGCFLLQSVVQSKTSPGPSSEKREAIWRYHKQERPDQCS